MNIQKITFGSGCFWCSGVSYIENDVQTHPCSSTALRALSRGGIKHIVIGYI